MRFQGPHPTRRLLEAATHNCPCCGIQFHVNQAHRYDFNHPQKLDDDNVEYPIIVDRAFSPDGTPVDVCQRCFLPCCPRCERIVGEGMIACTRCTTHPGCEHNADDPIAVAARRAKQ